MEQCLDPPPPPTHDKFWSNPLAKISLRLFKLRERLSPVCYYECAQILQPV